MIRTQIQITPEQAHRLKQLAAREGKSVAELIRLSVDEMLRSGGIVNRDDLRRKAIAAAGILSGPQDLAESHDAYLAEALER
ncbi:MAG TPA: ribbon-helix-helix protein, CopG family [Anaerolineales bacterium]|nr:ribbon-helix-helix protein, CopG family [Anaerolineales bacterium]